MKITLFDKFSPKAEITVISQNKCPVSLLQTCNVPDGARSHVKNCTETELINNEGIFVRGVNSSFYEVKIKKNILCMNNM